MPRVPRHSTIRRRPALRRRRDQRPVSTPAPHTHPPPHTPSPHPPPPPPPPPSATNHSKRQLPNPLLPRNPRHIPQLPLVHLRLRLRPSPCLRHRPAHRHLSLVLTPQLFPSQSRVAREPLL